MPTFNIPSTNIPAGQSTYGPQDAPNPMSSFDANLDMANATQPIAFTLLWAPDGVNFQLVAASGGIISGGGRSGTTAHVGVGWNPPKSGTTPKVKLVVDNPASFQSAGGNITLG